MYVLYIYIYIYTYIYYVMNIVLHIRISNI